MKKLRHDLLHDIKSLEAERDRLKAELAALGGLQGDLIAAFDCRDLWKSKAEKLAERLRWSDEALDCIQDGSSLEKLHKHNKEALAEFEKGK